MKCQWQTEYGTINSPQTCGKQAKRPHIYCAEHTRDAKQLYPHRPVPVQTRTVYRVHLNSGDQDYPSKREAFRQAGNIAAASGVIVAVTEEQVPKHT